MVDNIPAAEAPRKSIPAFLRISIFALIAITVFVIGSLFFDGIENRGSKIFLTFLTFGAFTLLTALDSQLSERREWYSPVAMVSNFLFLGSSMLLIWVPKNDAMAAYNNFLGITTFTAIFFLVLILRGGLLVSIFARGAIDNPRRMRKVEEYEGKSAIAAAWLANGAAALYAIYFVVYNIDGNTQGSLLWDTYLKVATAVLILAGLALAISQLLAWFFGAEERKIRAEENRSRMLAGGEPLKPWPTFEDGRPLPMGADGQPDFEAAWSAERKES